MLHEVLHLVIVHLLLQHELQIRPLDFAFEEPFHVGKSCAGLNVGSHLLHCLFDVVEIGLLVELLVQLVADIGQIGLNRQNLFNISDALVLYL